MLSDTWQTLNICDDGYVISYREERLLPLAPCINQPTNQPSNQPTSTRICHPQPGSETPRSLYLPCLLMGLDRYCSGDPKLSEAVEQTASRSPRRPERDRNSCSMSVVPKLRQLLYFPLCATCSYRGQANDSIVASSKESQKDEPTNQKRNPLKGSQLPKAGRPIWVSSTGWLAIWKKRRNC